MPQPEQDGQNPRTRSKNEIDTEIIRAIIEQQKLRVQLEEKQLLLEEKKLDYNSKLAERSLEHNSSFLKEIPNYRIRLLTRQASIFIILILIVLGFIGFCLYIGKDEIVKN